MEKNKIKKKNPACHTRGSTADIKVNFDRLFAGKHQRQLCMTHENMYHATP